MVVIDVPPLLGVDDGRMLAMLADDVIFAIRWGRTSRAAAAGALKTLRSASASVFGAVLTRVDLKKHALYGEGDSLQYQHAFRSEEHTSELQSLMRISYAVFCLKKQNRQTI